VLWLSDLSEHTANLRADPHASLLVAAPGAADPPAAPRTTLVGRLDPVGERAAAGELYRAVHPGAFWAGFADFHPFRMEVTGVRYIGGFARAGRVDPADYAAADPDPLHPHAARIVAHMNDDHADALVEFCRVLGGRPDTGWARMTSVDRYGFDVLAAPADGDPPRAVRISFPRSTDTPNACRVAMVDLVGRIRGSDR
jgi:putative heme iron utilization protein